MFLRIQEPQSSSHSSSQEENSLTKEQTMLRKAKSDKMLQIRNTHITDIQNGPMQTYKQRSLHKRKQSDHHQHARRNLRVDTQMSAIQVIESVLIEGARSAGGHSGDYRTELNNCRETESVVSRSCLESVRDSLISETKRRKDLEFSLQLKDRMITELKLQNDLYEQIGQRQSQLSNVLSPISEREKDHHAELRKFHINYNNVEQKHQRADTRHKVVKPSLKEMKLQRETDILQKKQTINQHQNTQIAKQNSKYKKLVRAFGDTLSKMARKQVTRDGKQSKDLRELWDTWNRLVRDLT